MLTVDGDGRYRFTHELTATAAYESMLKSERVSLHARIADSLPTVTHVEPERLAFHLEAAGRRSEAAVSWLRASARAIRASRHRDAQHHARRAVDLLDALGPDVPDGDDNRGRALVNLAIGLQATSHGSDELSEVIERLDTERVERIDPSRTILVGLIDVSNRQALGDFAGADRVARDVLASAESIADDISAAFARQFLGATLVWRGDLDGGTAILEEAAAFWDQAAAPPPVAARTVGGMWSLLGLAAHLQDRAAGATRLLERARATIPDKDGYGRCLVATTSAVVDQLEGRAEVVRAAVEPVWSLAMDLSSEFWMRWAQMLLGWAVAADADVGVARSGAEMMAEVVDDKEATPQAMPYFAYLLGERLAEQGHHGEAIGRLDAGLAVATETGEGLWVPLLHLARARCLAAAGHRAGALAAVEQASSLASTMGAALVVRRCGAWRAQIGRK